ncbi:MAG: hypothetical protein ACJAVK_001541 [Akkermansiaceae bacterium]|jgi:hypothetical protein
MPRGETVEFIKTAIKRMIGRLCAIVAPPKRTCGIAARLKKVGQRGFVWVESARPRAHTTNSRAEIGTPRQKLSSGGSANRAHVEILKRRPDLRPRIDS